ncbi:MULTISPECIES: apolipoprotein N-acyltransferase [Pirellulaceae]|uniref:apolipoprotein N-acyltransferase n=1 Tax=Pirellulaceae TaxID=2691357 RepID=UPI001304B67B|nr:MULTISPECIES: apolipoprotein N-acyltransferase [Pirellulaceae]
MNAPESSSTTSTTKTAAPSSLSWQKILAISIASSLLLAAAFPPLNLFPLAWIAPIGWLLLIRTPVLPKRSYWILYLSGLLFWLTVLYGVGNAHWATRLFGWPVLCGYLACYTPLFVAISRVIVHRVRVPLPIVAPIVWTALEYFRAYFVTGFSLALLGHTQVHLLPMVQIAEFVGAYGVSFVMMLVAAFLVSSIPTIWNEPSHPPDPKVLRRIVLAFVAFVIAIGYYGFGYFLWDMNGMQEWGYRGDHHDENARSVRIGLVQGSIDTVFGDPTQSSRTFEQYTALTDHLAKAHPDLDLIVWPETTMGDHMVFELGADYAPPADLPIDVQEHKKRITDRANGFNGFLKDLAVNRWQAPLLLGTSALRYGNQRLDHYNTAIHVGHEGTIINRYDKVHPVMFGEYVPFGDYAPFVYDWLPIGGGLTPGKGPVAVDVEGVSLVPCICFENTVPQLVAGQVRQLHEQGHDVDALVTLTNDGWFWGSSILDLHLTCARFRAIENRRPMLVAANTGISAVIAPSGHLSQYSPVRKTTYLVAELYPTNRPLTYYTRYGDWFAAGCLVLTIVGGVAGWLIRRWKAQPPL